MNILYITSCLDVSGVTKLNFDILKGLGEEWNVHICTTQPDDGFIPTLDSSFAQTFQTPFKLSDISETHQYKQFVNYLIQQRINLIFNTHSLWLYEHVARVKRDLPNVKIVDSLHVLEPSLLRGGSPDYSANRFVHPYIDKSILISNNLLEYLVKYYDVAKNKLVIVKNGIDTTRFNRNRCRHDEFKSELGVSPGNKLIGFIGRIMEQKRPLLFLDVAYRILEQRSDVHFYMLGDGEMKSEVVKYAAKLEIADRVTLLSSRDDIPYVLSGTDVFILTSSYEGAPLTILEALACGVPVVASDVGAIREYVEDSCCIINSVAKKNMIEPFAEAAIGLLARTLMPNFDLDYFGMQRVIKDYREVFLDVCGN